MDQWMNHRQEVKNLWLVSELDTDKKNKGNIEYILLKNVLLQ
jgi:hypothetical protein